MEQRMGGLYPAVNELVVDDDDVLFFHIKHNNYYCHTFKNGFRLMFCFFEILVKIYSAYLHYCGPRSLMK